MPKRRELTVAERTFAGCVAFATRENRQKSGRKPKTTARQDRCLERLALRNRFQTPRQLTADLSVEQDVSVCDRTVRRRSAEVNLKDLKSRRKPYLSQQQMKTRLLRARKYKDWTVEDWSKLIWSDESNIEMFGTLQLSLFAVDPARHFVLIVSPQLSNMAMAAS
ncbi:hypothetical protein Trydic_g9991 [Trypoxylus dichotomus]